MLTVLAVVGLAVLAAFVCAAVLYLPDSTRVALPWIFGVVGIVLLGVAVWQWQKLGEASVAKWYERVQPALGDRLTNAVQLAEKTGTSSVEEFLRQEAVELGR